MSSPAQEHFQANITIITCLKYDDYSNCITFAGESVFQALNIITILNILDHAYRNFSIIGGGGGGVILSLSKKKKEEGNSLVGYRRYCYATALRDVCNLIILESLSFVFNDKRQAKKNLRYKAIKSKWACCFITRMLNYSCVI